MRQRDRMEHMLVKATVTEATDKGTFTAVISTVSIDRDDDIVEPSAVVAALRKWHGTGKKVPLSWNHSVDAEDIIGHIEPSSVHEQAGEVVAEGWVDQSFDRGKHAWRLVKSGTLGFSYGYIVLDAIPRGSGKGLHIKSVDIFEVTATPIPANGDTRVLSYKSLAELKAAVEEAKQEAEQATMPDIPADAAEPEPEPEPEPKPPPPPPPTQDEVREQVGAVTKELAREAKREAPPAPPDPMVKAFAAFKPAGKTAEQVAAALDGMQLQGGTLYVRLLTDDEVAGVKSGDVKAVWSAAYVNNLPDSAFLHIEPGGAKDSEGKTTPRALRHFPYKDAGGTVDLPHLRNALARIPQSSLPQTVKDTLTRKAQGILDRSKSVEVTDKEKDPYSGGSRSVDPLVKEATALANQFAREDFPRKHTPAPPPPAPVGQTPSPGQLRREVYEEMLVHLRGEFNG